MRLSVLAVCILFFSISVLANDGKAVVCTLKGKVSDVQNAEALSGAVIRIIELNKQTYAGFDGSFSFSDLPAGTYTIEIAYTGYEKTVIQAYSLEKQVMFMPVYLIEL